jgi:alpha-glucosidase
MTRKWWHDAVFYQIYPRSFADANGDGIGDINGMRQKLDYLAWLGIDAVWLSPHYPSPQYDCGYDISDYCDVAPEYGTLDDFRAFLAEAHARNIRVIIDFVLNHTSHLHSWFIESRSSKDNPKRDWYIWRDGDGDNPPNNWQSTFGGSAWEYDPTTGQYYYHFFLKEQPDLNWRNPQVVQAMLDVARFWLDMGVDGFRLDAVGTIFEDEHLPNHLSPYRSVDFLRNEVEVQLGKPRTVPEKEWERLFVHQVNLPQVHDIMKALRRLTDEYTDRVLIGETADIPYLGDGHDELHMIFNFNLLRDAPFTADWIRENLTKQYAQLPPGGWMANTLNNHDSTRAISRYDDGTAPIPRAKLSAALLLTLEFTPFLYNGEEIGMSNFDVPHRDQMRDTLALLMGDILINDGHPLDEVYPAMQKMTRDRCRTPMLWANAPNGGFSPEGIRTWLPVHPEYAHGVNVADQQADHQSLLLFYRALITLRKSTPALQRGDYREWDVDNDRLFAFVRRTDAQICAVLLNFESTVQLAYLYLPMRVIFSTHGRTGALLNGGVRLSPFEILILEG